MNAHDRADYEDGHCPAVSHARINEIMGVLPEPPVERMSVPTPDDFTAIFADGGLVDQIFAAATNADGAPLFPDSAGCGCADCACDADDDDAPALASSAVPAIDAETLVALAEYLPLARLVIAQVGATGVVPVDIFDDAVAFVAELTRNVIHEIAARDEDEDAYEDLLDEQLAQIAALQAIIAERDATIVDLTARTDRQATRLRGLWTALDGERAAHARIRHALQTLNDGAERATAILLGE